MRLNSLTEIALTKLDVLDKFDEIKVCVAYEHDGVRYDHMPFHQSVLHEVTPIYETLRGWECELTSITHIDQMPATRDGVRALPRREDRRADLGGGCRPRARTVRAHVMTRCVVVGSGAREHAFAHALAKTAEVVVTPGNDGIAAHGLTCVTTPATDLDADLFVVGPEAPLVDGLADRLRTQGKTVVGPGEAGAQLEGSKSFMKEFLTVAGVPTAAYGVFSDEAAAAGFLDTMTPPYVIKTDGLAAGKGVLVTSDLDEAKRDITDKLSGKSFGDAGRTIVLEEGLVGEECSLHVLCDGADVVVLARAQDFKRVGRPGRGCEHRAAWAPTRRWPPLAMPT